MTPRRGPDLSRWKRWLTSEQAAQLNRGITPDSTCRDCGATADKVRFHCPGWCYACWSGP